MFGGASPRIKKRQRAAALATFVPPAAGLRRAKQNLPEAQRALAN
jgi:hypothetical protein